ncbi:MAG: oxygen-independent coproporphyrinogen III oxidase, partial [Brachymonas sp.]|nr:oxygen-independent coproporphyrinogen III oxidase [Brachymonas sp.]
MKPPPITPELLARYNISGPRYTSYPTADRFHADFAESHYLAALQQRQTQQQTAQGAQPLSVYVHLPFCQSLCYFCACNKIVTQRTDAATSYLQYLQREIDLQAAHLGGKQSVSQLHLGGGTPTFLNDAQLQQLMSAIRQAFTLLPDGEYSIEVDPRTVDAQRLQHLAQLGFNRISFGVQDFDSGVQQAIHREQPAQQVAALVHAARAAGFKSINLDLIYGLPLQTPTSFAATLQQVVQLAPNRIALYAYAHLPERFKPQRRIDAYKLPAADEKIRMLAQSLQTFSEAGYIYIGMDHFALPNDALAVARQQGRLQRNFQGYSTQPDCDLIGLGVSAIGKVGNTYSQNAKTLPEYQQALDSGHLPIERGLSLNRDEQIRRAVIMAIMCQG